MLTVFTGGARSGKSTAASRLADGSDAPVTVIATAQPLDAEMRERIERHRTDRPAGWVVIEEPLALDHAVSAAIADRPGATILVDCLGLWVTNRLDDDEDRAILEEATSAAVRLGSHRGAAIVVTNEVGDGIVPDNAISRRFRDVLGLVNQIFVGQAADAYLCVAGRALELKTLEEL